MMRYRNSFGPPAGFSSISATHRACQALERQVKGSASAKWAMERAFYDPEVPRIMRRAAKRAEKVT